MSHLSKMQAAGFSVDLIGDQLVIKPADQLTDLRREFIRKHKLELVAEILAANDVQPEKTYWMFKVTAPDGSIMEVTTTPWSTLVEVERMYPNHAVEVVECAENA